MRTERSVSSFSAAFPNTAQMQPKPGFANRNEEAEGLPFHIGERTSTKAQGPRDDGTALLGGPATNPQRWGAAIPRPPHPRPGSTREA